MKKRSSSQKATVTTPDTRVCVSCKFAGTNGVSTFLVTHLMCRGHTMHPTPMPMNTRKTPPMRKYSDTLL